MKILKQKQKVSSSCFAISVYTTYLNKPIAIVFNFKKTFIQLNHIRRNVSANRYSTAQRDENSY